MDKKLEVRIARLEKMLSQKNESAMSRVEETANKSVNNAISALEKAHAVARGSR